MERVWIARKKTKKPKKKKPEEFETPPGHIQLTWRVCTPQLSLV